MNLNNISWFTLGIFDGRSISNSDSLGGRKRVRRFLRVETLQYSYDDELDTLPTYNSLPTQIGGMFASNYGSLK